MWGISLIVPTNKYANVDYVLAEVLRTKKDNAAIEILYDIACQYGIHLLDRFANKFPDLEPVVRRVRMFVPKMHLVLGHNEDCQYRFSLSYHACCARSSGENVETVWAPAKKTGAFTREMNGGHRHETLDAIHGDWNWRKVQHMGMSFTQQTLRVLMMTLGNSLYRTYTNALVHQQRTRRFFEGFSATLPEASVSAWEGWDTAPRREGGIWTSVYCLPGGKGIVPCS